MSNASHFLTPPAEAESGVVDSADARVDVRLTIIDRPLAADEELEAAVTGVVSLGLANDASAVVEDGTIRRLAWRGYLAGGLLTPYEGLGALVSDGGLGAFYGDPRLEVFVRSDCDAGGRVPCGTRSRWSVQTGDARVRAGQCRRQRWKRGRRGLVGRGAVGWGVKEPCA